MNQPETPEPRLTRFSVALIQSEVEPPHTPGFDLSTFLSHDPRWLVETFTDRTIDSLPEVADNFDCLVIGFNALHQSRAIRDVFAKGVHARGILVMHQLDGSALSFLGGDLELSSRKLGVPSVEAVFPSVLGSLADEPLLNWPHKLLEEVAENSPQLIRAPALCCLMPPEGGAWRTVLEVTDGKDRVPVLLRTESAHQPRVVVCHLLLQPSDEIGAALLSNMITFCAGGLPDVVLLHGGTKNNGVTANMLRLQGVNAIELTDGAGTSGFDAWPLRCARTVLVEEEDRQTDASSRLSSVECAAWLQRGGTLVRTGGVSGLSFDYGVSDQHWIAQRWVIWFKSVDPATWHGGTDGAGKVWRGSIFQARGVLRVLDWLDRHPQLAQSRRLGLGSPSQYLAPVRRMLAARQDDEGSFDGTIGTTSAAFDIHRLLKLQALKSSQSTTNWLRSAFDRGAPGDRFDIARSLQDPDLFLKAQEYVAELKLTTPYLGSGPVPAVSPMLATRIRDAAVACRVEVDAIEGYVLAGDLLTQLDLSFMLAATYLNSLADFHTAYPDHPLAFLHGSDVDRCVRTIRKSGYILRMGEGNSHEIAEVGGEVISQEAMTLLSYSILSKTTTHVINPHGGALPPAVFEPILRQNEEARQLSNELRESRKLLGHIKIAVGILALAASLAFGSAGFVWEPPYVPNLTTALTKMVLCLAVLLALTPKGLKPDWLSEFFTEFAKGGLSGAPQTLANLFRRLIPRKES